MKVEEPTLEHRIYEVLLNLDLPLQELGIESVGGRPSENRIEILQRIEDEFYHRACAYYAHAFKRGFQ